MSDESPLSRAAAADNQVNPAVAAGTAASDGAASSSTAPSPSFGIDSFTLKLVAIIGMTADHIGNVFWPQLPQLARCLLFAPGGLTFPIMAFLLAVGYRHTHDVRAYAIRLGIFALISLVPFWWALSENLNVLFTLLLGLGIIWAYDHLENRLLFSLLFLAAIVATHWCDWSYVGVPMILLYHIGIGQVGEARARRTDAAGGSPPPASPGKSRLLALALPVFTAWILGIWFSIQIIEMGGTPELWILNSPQLLYLLLGCSATIPLLYFYNGQRGRPMKYFFYGYYPAHIALLGLLRGLLFGIWLG